MNEFLEVAGSTCRSGEAVAWMSEAAMEALASVTIEINGRAVVLCHTPSDYNDRPSLAAGPAHSTGCHFNMLSPRPLSIEQAGAFAALTSPLNAVFGPGGWTWSPQGAPRFCCDPRAYHIIRLVAGAAHHHECGKPFFLSRNEPYACPPFERLQCVAFGAPRSPLSSWMQAELLPLALRAVLAERSPPWCVADPIATLRAGADEPILLKSARPAKTWSMTKAELAADTVRWLAEVAEEWALGPNAAGRIVRIRELGVNAARASAAPTAQPPVFPTDIAIKRSLFDRAAQACGFAGLCEVGRACAADPSHSKVCRAVDALVIADVFFSSPSRQHSTYELASRNGLFIRPQFQHRIDLGDLSRLPAGVSRRDCVRASLLIDPSWRDQIRFCDWDQLYLSDGTVWQLCDPWSDLNRLIQ
jgi:hypothetical protein